MWLSYLFLFSTAHPTCSQFAEEILFRLLLPGSPAYTSCLASYWPFSLLLHQSQPYIFPQCINIPQQNRFPQLEDGLPSNQPMVPSCTAISSALKHPCGEEGCSQDSGGYRKPACSGAERYKTRVSPRIHMDSKQWWWERTLFCEVACNLSRHLQGCSLL